MTNLLPQEPLLLRQVHVTGDVSHEEQDKFLVSSKQTNVNIKATLIQEPM
jgi:hypothetical protein